jgi:Phasin protein
MMMAVESKAFEQGSSGKGKSGATASPAQEGSEAMVNMQKELLDVYEQASRAWLARVKSEVDLWSDLASKLSATRSMPEALESYQKFVTQRMQMAAEDGRQLVEDCQKITQKMIRSLSSAGWPTTSS